MPERGQQQITDAEFASLARTLATESPLQWDHIREAAAKEDRKRAESFEERRPLSIDWPRIRSAIKRASEVEGLRRVWPDGLSARVFKPVDWGFTVREAPPVSDATH